MDSEAIVAIVFMGLFAGCGLIVFLATTLRKIVEARHQSHGNPEELNALRHEVAHLRSMMSDVMLQLEYQQKASPQEDLEERLTPPEFKLRS